MTGNGDVQKGEEAVMKAEYIDGIVWIEIV
jgi:hypothetical protein